ncbi:unnamed protein product, partial [Adineta ricciae]
MSCHVTCNECIPLNNKPKNWWHHRSIKIIGFAFTLLTISTVCITLFWKFNNSQRETSTIIRTIEKSKQLRTTNVYCLGWSLTGSMRYARGGHNAILLHNKKVLVTGGANRNDGILKSAELYDALSKSWELTGTMVNSRIGHAVIMLNNKTVLAVSGDNDSGMTTSTELYDPFTETWTPTGDVHFGRNGHTASLLADGKILIVGGFDE